MSKGKKIDAAEKHFLKKEEKYRAEIKDLKERLAVVDEEAKKWRLTYEAAKDQIDEKDKTIRKLIEYLGMTAEEAKAAVKREQNIKSALSLLNASIEKYGPLDKFGL